MYRYLLSSARAISTDNRIQLRADGQHLASFGVALLLFVHFPSVYNSRVPNLFSPAPAGLLLLVFFLQLRDIDAPVFDNKIYFCDVHNIRQGDRLFIQGITACYIHVTAFRDFQRFF